MPKSKGRMSPAQTQSNPFNLKKILKSSSWAELEASLPKDWTITEATFANRAVSSLHLDLAKDVEMILFNHKNRGRWA